jgi:hypothetical protein
MKLFIESIFLSAASTNDRTPADDTPCDSGSLRDKPEPKQVEQLNATAATIVIVRIDDLMG